MSLAVTLLGTGSPMPAPDRAGPATLISAGEGPDAEQYLVDAGRGVLRTRQVVDHILASLDPDIGYRMAHHDDLHRVEIN